MARALAASRRADPRRRARRAGAAGAGELESRGGLEAPALSRDRALARRATGEAFLPYTHYGVGGNTKFWGSVLYRLRREDFQAIEHVDGVSPAWPIDYDTLEPYYERAERLYHVHGQHGGDPTEPARGPFPYAPIPHARRHGGDRRRAAGVRACIRRHLPLGLIRPGEPGGCVLCSTCNSFPCRIHAKSDAEVCGIEPALAQRERRAVDQRARAAPRHRSGRADGRGGRGRARRRRPFASSASLVVVSCGAVNSAALLLRSAERQAPARPRELVRPGRPALHGAPRDDDAGVQSAPEERHGLSEDRGHQRLLPAWARHDVPARADSVAGADARRDGADRAMPRMPVWAYDAWVSRGVDWLAMSEDLPRDDNRVTIDARRPDPAALSPEQPRGARDAGQGDDAHPAPAGLLEGDDALAQEQEHDASVRHARASAPTRARRCSIPAAARTTSRTSSSSTRRSSRRPPRSTRADDRGAGAAGGRPHQGRRDLSSSAGDSR